VFSQSKRGKILGKAAHNRKTGAREPNGQLSRKQQEMRDRAFSEYDREERETMETGLAARERQFGLPRVKADDKGRPVAVSRDPMAGSFIGRCCINGELTLLQYDAAMRWLSDWEAYSRAIQAPKSPGAVQINDAPKGGYDGDYENVGKALGSIESYDKAKRAVQEAQYEASNGIGCRFALLGVLWHLVQQDMNRHDMLPELRTALNVLVRHYKLGAKVREAA
jgi:hypothetical protein